MKREWYISKRNESSLLTSEVIADDVVPEDSEAFNERCSEKRFQFVSDCE
jgi:hypothetical protein